MLCMFLFYLFRSFEEALRACCHYGMFLFYCFCSTKEAVIVSWQQTTIKEKNTQKTQRKKTKRKKRRS